MAGGGGLLANLAAADEPFQAVGRETVAGTFWVSGKVFVFGGEGFKFWVTFWIFREMVLNLPFLLASLIKN